MSQNPLISRLLDVLGPPEHSPNIQSFIAEYSKLLNHFGPTVLNRAADRLIAQAGRRWPTPKACVDMCTDVQEHLASIEAAKPRHAEAPKMPWEIQAEQAREWAIDFCKHTKLGEEAFNEGWGKALFQVAQAYARECYRTGTNPIRTGIALTKDFIDDAKRNRGPKNWYWIDRVTILGEQLDQAIADNRRIFGPSTTDSVAIGGAFGALIEKIRPKGIRP